MNSTYQKPDTDTREADAEEKRPSQRPAFASPIVRKLSICLCALCAVVFFVWGLLFFLRPAVSETEKRELTKFPAITWKSFRSGEWTEQISLWYADTFPGRDGLTSAFHGLKSLYGIRDELYEGGTGDNIPDGTMGDPDAHTQEEPETTAPVDPNAGSQGETIGGYYVTGDTAYELYYFKESNSYRYAAVIRKAGETLKGRAQVYDLVVPLSYSFALGADVQKELGAADGQKVAAFLYSGMGDDVRTVDVYGALMAHRNEYLFFRTDHHWTATGAYWAYDAFCRKAGITPTPLSAYEKLTFDGFLGTLYAKTEQPAAMTDHPDYVEAYVPAGTNSMVIVNTKGETESVYPIIQRKTDIYYTNPASKYNCFIAGDNPLTTIHNDRIAQDRRGTSVLLIKESFGNAFAPFLVDSYEYVYVLDYRYFKGEPDGAGGMKNADLASFVSAHGIGTVIFLNNVDATTADARLTELERLVK